MTESFLADYAITATLIRLFYIAVAVALLFILARARDKLIGLNLKQVIEEDGMSLALAIYLGSTAIAIAMVISSFTP